MHLDVNNIKEKTPLSTSYGRHDRTNKPLNSPRAHPRPKQDKARCTMMQKRTPGTLRHARTNTTLLYLLTHLTKGGAPSQRRPTIMQDGGCIRDPDVPVSSLSSHSTGLTKSRLCPPLTVHARVSLPGRSLRT